MLPVFCGTMEARNTSILPVGASCHGGISRCPFQGAGRLLNMPAHGGLVQPQQAACLHLAHAPQDAQFHTLLLAGGEFLPHGGCEHLDHPFPLGTVGGVFPQGLLIGTIAEVHTEAGGQSPYGVVEPACDLDQLSQVFVIKDFNVVE